jgi:hypothetical protein
MMPDAPRSFPVPQTRIPFVNSQFTHLERNGKPWLMTGMWGGPNKGRVYLIDPQTGESLMRPLPDGEPGVYMLRTGTDGRVYLGSGTGKLYRYDPKADTFERLIEGQLNGITWGGCVSDRYVIWSANPGETCVYDWREERLKHVFKPFDTEVPSAHYGHSIVNTPDKKVLAGMNVPQARLVLLDPATGERQSIMPAVLKGVGWLRDLTFFDASTLGLLAEDKFILFRYPSFELLHCVPAPEGVKTLGGQSCLCAGDFYTISGPDGSVRRLRRDYSGWDVVLPDIFYETYAYLNALDDRYLCAINLQGEFFRYELKTKELFRKEIDAWGPVGVHALCPAPEIGKVYGSTFINSRFWEFDTAKGAGRDLGRTAGQVNCIVWDPQTQRALMAVYTTCRIAAFDPTQPANYPKNPYVLAQIKDEQMRPKAMIHDGRYVWVASSAQYGKLGGALSRVDPLDGSVKTWRHLAQDQTPNSVVFDPDRQRVYVGTDIHADCESAPATQKTGRLVSFDAAKLVKINEIEPAAEPAFRVLALLRPGVVLATDSKQICVWNADQNRIEQTCAAPKGLRAIVRDSKGRHFASAEGKVGRLELTPNGCNFTPIADGPAEYLSSSGNTLWYAVDQELRRLEV